MARIDNHNGQAWRARADECRAIADTFENPETRAKMYRVAADYERMAENADRRAREEAGAQDRQGGDPGAGTVATSP